MAPGTKLQARETRIGAASAESPTKEGAMTTFDPQTLRGSTILDPAGNKIGKVDNVFVDTGTGKPECGLLSVQAFSAARCRWCPWPRPRPSKTASRCLSKRQW